MSVPFLRLPGLSFREELSGKYWRLSRPVEEHRIALRLTARAADVGATLQSRIWKLSGTLNAEGLASQRPIEGTLTFKLFDERRLPYRLSFRGDDGIRYELSGQKEWNAFAPFDALTLLSASIYEEGGGELARATLRFDLLANWSQWLRNVRWLSSKSAGL